MKSITFETSLLPSIEKIGEHYTYHAHQTIYFQNDDSSNFYFIKKGRVRVYILNHQGKDRTIEVLEEGRVFGESSLFTHSLRLTSVEAINEVELIACKPEQLVPLLEQSPQLMMDMLTLLSKTVRTLAKQVERLSIMNAEERVIDFLLYVTEQPHQSLGITNNCIPYTHQEIAECTCLERVTVTKILKKLEEQGCLSLGYRKVYIQNREQLQTLIHQK